MATPIHKGTDSQAATLSGRLYLWMGTPSGLFLEDNNIIFMVTSSTQVVFAIKQNMETFAHGSLKV